MAIRFPTYADEELKNIFPPSMQPLQTGKGFRRRERVFMSWIGSLDEFENNRSARVWRPDEGVNLFNMKRTIQLEDIDADCDDSDIPDVFYVIGGGERALPIKASLLSRVNGAPVDVGIRFNFMEKYCAVERHGRRYADIFPRNQSIEVTINRKIMWKDPIIDSEELATYGNFTREKLSWDCEDMEEHGKVYRVNCNNSIIDYIIELAKAGRINIAKDKFRYLSINNPNEYLNIQANVFEVAVDNFEQDFLAVFPFYNLNKIEAEIFRADGEAWTAGDFNVKQQFDISCCLEIIYVPTWWL